MILSWRVVEGGGMHRGKRRAPKDTAESTLSGPWEGVFMYSMWERQNQNSYQNSYVRLHALCCCAQPARRDDWSADCPPTAAMHAGLRTCFACPEGQFETTVLRRRQRAQPHLGNTSHHGTRCRRCSRTLYVLTVCISIARCHTQRQQQRNPSDRRRPI